MPSVLVVNFVRVRGTGIGGAGGAVAPPTFASFDFKKYKCTTISALAPPTLQWFNAKAPPIFHTFRHPCDPLLLCMKTIQNQLEKNICYQASKIYYCNHG